MTLNTFCRLQFSGYGDNMQLKINPDLTEDVDTKSHRYVVDNKMKWTNVVNQGA